MKTLLKKIKKLKSAPFGNLSIRGIHNSTPYQLLLLTRDTVDNQQIVALLAGWRKKHERWFQAQFPVTRERTRKWLQEKVMQAPDRLLFMISINGTYLGHVGLFRFNVAQSTCEIDNIVRGRKGYSGIMGDATKLMMAWGKETLGLKGYTLRTSSDNIKALRLYKRLGFVEICRFPLIYKKTSDGGGWIKAPAVYQQPIERYDISMKLKAKQLKPSKKKISFAGPSITKKEINYVIDAVKHGFYETYDRHIKKLEQAVASYVGTRYALAGFCATHSMHLACLVCGFTKGDEVIVTDFSWAATAHVIAYTGATPVFVDIDPDTWCIDPVAIKRAITKKTKGIMLVHSFGIPADMDSIVSLSREYHLKVIEDAAPALGSLYKGKKVGSFGDVGCISFHGAKIAVSGEGGMFLTNNKKMLDDAVLLSNMGRTNRLANFWCDSLGYEYQMANVSAALALAQVERIEDLVRKKRQIFSWYYERLKNVRYLKLIKEREYMRSNYAYPAVLLMTDKITRNDLVQQLRKYNIHAREAFPRMSGFPIYHRRYTNPEAAKVEKYGFNLPSALNLNEKDIDFVCQVLIDIIS